MRTFQSLCLMVIFLALAGTGMADDTAYRTIKSDCILYTIIPGSTLVKLGIHERTYIPRMIRLDITI